MRQFNVKDIPENSFFSKPAYLDSRFIVFAPEIPITKEYKKILTNWEFKELLSEGEPGLQYHPESAEGAPDETGTIESIRLNDDDKLSKARELYAAMQQYTENLFSGVIHEGTLEFNPVAEKMKEFYNIIREDWRFLLRVLRDANTAGNYASGVPAAGDDAAGSRDYLVSHGVKSAIISLVIGTYLKLPVHRLIELGVAALLHEIGMIKLPSRIYLNRGELSPQEYKAIRTHPILSFNILKSFGFPLTICLAALEHHERENGNGYPQKLTGNKISSYAKILAVACSFEALTSTRPYRDAKDSHVGILDLLKNVGKQYDDVVVRALVFSLSIYPIGLYVLLSNGSKGQVVDVNPENPQFPVVQIFGELNPDGKARTLETSASGVSIVRPLLREEIGSP
ncbi:MAG: HD-GYP domain-containing protein [Treponema sp.]|jgi:HD-GYP domain-containing protein (c-di-GMP phosphodiesterase class II)|nr:HD-GYP domain-containing protein [Treponema sp.]